MGAPDELVVSLNGRTLRLPLPKDWTGTLHVNVHLGHLAQRHHKIQDELLECLGCGGRDIAAVGRTAGVERSG